MTRLYNILRALAVSALAIAVIVPVVLYVILSIGAVQREIGKIGEQQLSELLGAEVKIGELTVNPFNKLLLKDVAVIVAPGDTALRVERLGGGIVLSKLLLDRRMVFSYAEIIGLDARLWRDSANAPLNIQPIIDRLSPKDKNKPPTQYDLRINNIVIRQSALSYDVLDSPRRNDRFDAKHIKVYGLKADLLLPKIKNDDYVVRLRRLALREQSGLSIDELSGMFMASDSRLAIEDFNLVLPESRLLLDRIELKYDGWADLTSRLAKLPFSLRILDGSVITPSDLRAFEPHLSKFGRHIDIRADIVGSVSDFNIDRLLMRSSDGLFDLGMNGKIKGLPVIKDLEAQIPGLSLDIEGKQAGELLATFTTVSPKVVTMLGNLGRVRLSGEAEGNVNSAFYNGTVLTSAGNLDLNATYTGENGNRHHVDGEVVVENLALGDITGDTRLGVLTAHINADTEIAGSSVNGKVNAVIDEFDYKNYSYNNITAEVDIDGKHLSGAMAIDDENIKVAIDGNADLTPGNTDCDIRVSLRDFSPYALNLTDRYDGYRMSADMSVDLHGVHVENMDGRIEINRMEFRNEENDGVELPHFVLMSSGSTVPQYILVHSDIFDAQIKGRYRFKDIVPAAGEILADVMPVLFHDRKSHERNVDNRYVADFELSLDIKENDVTNSWLKFFKAPMRVLHTVNLSAAMDIDERVITLGIDAPYLLQKDKFIDNTSVQMSVDGNENKANVFLTTLYPTKKGNARIEFSGAGENDRVNTRISWDIDREKEFGGELDLAAYLYRNETTSEDIAVNVDINKSRIVFNDTAWTVHPASVQWSDKRVVVNDIDISRAGQFVRISGSASANPVDVLCLELQDISLDYVFETLDISNVMFGGVATGTFFASDLFSGQPRLSTPGLHVKGLSYNHSLLGDADIESAWDNETKGVTIDAVVTQDNGCKSYIDGAIYPIAQSLDFRFKADKLDVGFMKPYMEAFTSEISGYASGDARLYGTFKLIDMTGDIYAQDLKMKLDFTNTYYTTSDSIHLSPGRISFSDVVLKDAYGNHAKLDGWVTHKCFKEPEFEFNVTDARNFLCFDINEKLSPDWYGRIFCNGVAHIKGVPGFIDINVDMATAPQSTFTFVLSDTEAADEYTFMTFHDRDQLKGELLLSVEDPQKAAIKRLKEYYARLNREESTPTLYRINLQVNATPDGELILVMDPVGGDRIKARGNGNLRIEYNSADEDMRMFGTYTLSQGSYNFTLQDIIIKDFTIKPGSSISFHGDPLAAVLDIEAVYSVNANLSDLDESFLQDRELNRTNVPVHALLKVTGDMQQPDINFDLEFPTLTQDTYRKVKSIVSTDEMMNRQIIYLLALNRFYTPDYMASTTKGNELVSVASSTISSQLSSMLGQLSENWSIAPNIRSDKGDFSDMEVDLALSSYLLNNRLLFNGNFGYRDNALNNNSFIGDFDLEYLLNKSGNIRLKAYNRYNDQNYYVKSALTTQGVGVMFKRDFDDIFSFIKRLRKKDKKKTAAPVPADSINANIENGVSQHDK